MPATMGAALRSERTCREENGRPAGRETKQDRALVTVVEWFGLALRVSHSQEAVEAVGVLRHDRPVCWKKLTGSRRSAIQKLIPR